MFGNVTLITGPTLKCLVVLKDLVDLTVESLWYYDAMDINEMTLLKDGLGTNKMKTFTQLTRSVHLYVIHPLSQLEMIQEFLFSLEYNVVEPNVVDLDNVG